MVFVVINEVVNLIYEGDFFFVFGYDFVDDVYFLMIIDSSVWVGIVDDGKSCIYNCIIKKRFV